MKYCFIFSHAGALRSDYKNLENSLRPYYKCFYYLRENSNCLNWQDTIQSSFEFVKNHLKDPNDQYIILGHSMGAMQAYFTTRLLEKYNIKQASRVILSGMCPPTPDNVSELSKLMTLNEDDFTNEIIRFGGIPEQIIERKDLLDFFMTRIKDDIAKMKGVEATSDKIKSKVLCLSGIEDKKYSFSKMSEWAKFTTHSLETKIFNGGHFYIINLYQEVAEYIIKTLEKKINEF